MFLICSWCFLVYADVFCCCFLVCSDCLWFVLSCLISVLMFLMCSMYSSCFLIFVWFLWICCFCLCFLFLLLIVRDAFLFYSGCILGLCVFSDLFLMCCSFSHVFLLMFDLFWLLMLSASFLIFTWGFQILFMICSWYFMFFWYVFRGRLDLSFEYIFMHS